MNEEYIEVLKSINGVGETLARRIPEELARRGLTIYKKKVFANGRRPNSSQHMTPELRAAIRDYFEADPEVTQQEIANTFNVNIGRVSEVLT
jgi:dTDP-glucose pyrophosphorylase